MPETELGQKRVDSARLNAFLAATVSNPGSLDIIHPVRDYKRQSSEAFYDLTGCFCAQKTLQ